MKMKSTISLCFISLFFVFKSNGQQKSYDEEMKSLALDIAHQVKLKQKINIAVWYFKDSFRKRTVLGDYIGQEFSTYFVNASEGFDVMDRDAIEQILEEHKLKDEGFIDPTTEKELGMFISADAIITGTIDVSARSLRIRLKLIDIQTGKTLAAIPKNIPIDENIKYILHESGINQVKNIDEDKIRLNRRERYGAAEYVSVDCKNTSVGTYCFENETDDNYEVILSPKNESKSGNRYGSDSSEKLYVGAGSSACFNDLPVKSYKYELRKVLDYYPTMRQPKVFGNFNIEKCKAIIYKINIGKRFNATNPSKRQTIRN